MNRHDRSTAEVNRIARHLRDLALDAFTTRPEVAHIQTSLIFEWAKGKVMPNERAPTLSQVRKETP